MNPIIRIKYGNFLEPIFESHYRAQPGEADWIAYPPEQTHEIIRAYDAAWKPYKSRILDGLHSITGLEFFQNTIDVFIVSSLRGGFSVPMVISAQKEPDLFIDILSHELIHRLLTDNTASGEYNWREAQQKIFPDITEPKVINHIFVHAILKSLYLDVLEEPSRLMRDIARCERFADYKRAWEIVERNDYRTIIENLRREIFTQP